jgi:putative FmdB family regulatory protein
MPIYDYQCADCGTTYDVFHKVREVEEDVVCPSCQSLKHVRLISAASVAVKGSAAAERGFMPPCGDASCCGGSCQYQ